MAEDPSAPSASGTAVHGRGTVITFYSYKGGTGRTMALANTACALAWASLPNENVLVVDWDLEAPGLHRFFPGRWRRSRESSKGLGLDAEPGLIDLLIDLAEALPAQRATEEDEAEGHVREALARTDLGKYIGPTEYPNVWLLRAGRDDDREYSRRVNTFRWELLFLRAPKIYRLLAEELARRFRWVLVDSRTGVTDISGICTSLLPDKLVVVFTPNRQSLSGVRELVERALAYRRSSDDGRSLAVYPLPARIEASLEDQRRDWRMGNADAGIVGFQPVFEELFRECYALPHCDLGAYFDAVQIQQTPDCAYGEVISVREGGGDRFSLASSYREFVRRLTAPTAPWEAMAPTAEAARSLPSSEAPRQLSVSQAAPVAPSFANEKDAEQAIGQLPPTPHGPMSPRVLDREPNTSPGLPLPRSRRAFLSYASPDRPLVEPIAQLLQASGFDAFWDRERLQAGSDWRREIESGLDSADVVIVFWSQHSITSSFVQEEASEALRRGVLLPVLLDDVSPPLSFRTIQSLAFARATLKDRNRLVEVASQIAARRPGQETAISPGQMAPRELTHRKAALALGLFGLVGGLMLVFWNMFLSKPVSREGEVSFPPAPAVVAAGPSSVGGPPAPQAHLGTAAMPDASGRTSAEAKVLLEQIGLIPRMAERDGAEEKDFIDGVVVGQAVASGTVLVQGTRVRLIVATQTALVPELKGLTLAAATKALQTARLKVDGTPEQRTLHGPSAVVIAQNPTEGKRVAAGSGVRLTLTSSKVSKRPLALTLEIYVCDSNRSASQERANKVVDLVKGRSDLSIARKRYKGNHDDELMKSNGGFFVVRHQPGSSGEAFTSSIVDDASFKSIAPWGLQAEPKQEANIVSIFICVAP